MKMLRYNKNPFMNKSLRKAIMKRSKLKNEFNKNSSAEDWKSYKKQRNFCLKLLRQAKEKYFNNLSVSKYLITQRFGNQLNHFSQTRV